MATVLFILIPFARLLELGLEKAWNWGVALAEKNDSGD